jgi:hypothetical protein
MRLFLIEKRFGSSSVNGEGAILHNGKVIVNWIGDIDSIVIYDNFDDFQKLHKESVQWL